VQTGADKPLMIIRGRLAMNTTTTGEAISSSEARAAIMSCHEELRGLVTETIHAAEKATASDNEFEPLRNHALLLFQAFEEHMDFEEELLPAALRDVIGRGPMLAKQVVDVHERRRSTLVLAMSALEPGLLPRKYVVDSVRALADTLLRDLKSEERCFYTADLDAIVTDAHGG
jgi:hypothetical protein